MLRGKKQGEIDIDLINLNPDQPRKIFDMEELRELTASIVTYGVLQPIIVTKTAKGEYFLIAGERRLRAAKMAGLAKIPTIIKDVTDKEIALIALVENIQRENLSFIEEAYAYKRLMEEYKLSQVEIAKQVGKQQSTISNKMRLLNLPDKVIEEVLSYNLTERHARALLRLENDELCEKVIERIVSNSLNVKQTEKLIEDILLKKSEEERKSRKIEFIHQKIYINTLKKTFNKIKDVEKEAQYFQTESGEFYEIKIIIPKHIKNHA